MALSAEQLQGVADRIEITELLARYHQAIDRLDWDTVRLVFTDDAVCDYVGMSGLFDIPGEPRRHRRHHRLVGRGLRPLDRPQHFMSNIVFELDGDRARTRSYLWSAGGRGVYECEHVRTPAGWRIGYLRLEHVQSEQQVAALQAQRQVAAPPWQTATPSRGTTRPGRVGVRPSGGRRRSRVRSPGASLFWSS